VQYVGVCFSTTQLIGFNMSYTFTNRLLLSARQVREAISREPQIRPDYSGADLKTIVVVMYAAMWSGVYEPDALYHYLEARGAPITRDAFNFLLDAFEGDTWEHHLWSRGNLGDYVPVLGAMPDEDGPGAFSHPSSRRTPTPQRRAPDRNAEF
jgi:hypothetical protein